MGRKATDLWYRQPSRQLNESSPWRLFCCNKLIKKEDDVMTERFSGVAVAAMMLCGAVAGTLDEPSPPTETGSAMYTSGDLYNRLSMWWIETWPRPTSGLGWRYSEWSAVRLLLRCKGLGRPHAMGILTFKYGLRGHYRRHEHLQFSDSTGSLRFTRFIGQFHSGLGPLPAGNPAMLSQQTGPLQRGGWPVVS